MSLKLPRELACSCGMAHPTSVNNPWTVGNNTIGEEVVGKERTAKAGPVVLFAEKVCGLLTHISVFSSCIFFFDVFNFCEYSIGLVWKHIYLHRSIHLSTDIS